MKRNSILIAAALVLSSCAGQSFGSIASTVLNSGGFGGSSSSGGSSVEAFFTAGQNLIEAATPLTEEQEYYLVFRHRFSVSIVPLKMMACSATWGESAVPWRRFLIVLTPLRAIASW